MADVKPITRESFIAAYVDAHARDYMYCSQALDSWAELHSPRVWDDEINEDPS